MLLEVRASYAKTVHASVGFTYRLLVALRGMFSRAESLSTQDAAQQHTSDEECRRSLITTLLHRKSSSSRARDDTQG